MKKKHHHCTAQHEDRREQRAVEESGGSGMILPIRDCREVGRGESGGERGRWLHSDTPYDGVGDPRLNKRFRSYLGKREKKEERKERKARRETECGGCWVFPGTYTEPAESGHSG